MIPGHKMKRGWGLEWNSEESHSLAEWLLKNIGQDDWKKFTPVDKKETKFLVKAVNYDIRVM